MDNCQVNINIFKTNKNKTSKAGNTRPLRKFLRFLWAFYPKADLITSDKTGLRILPVGLVLLNSFLPKPQMGIG